MKKFFKILMLIILALAVFGTFYFLWNKSRPVEKNYNVEAVTIGNIEKRTVATGKVEPRNEILIKPQMSGIIAEIYKEAGDVVKAGDIIAKIKVIPDMVTNLNKFFPTEYVQPILQSFGWFSTLTNISSVPCSFSTL